MTDKEIKKEFEKIISPDKKLPEYKDPYSFTQEFEKCSILIYDEEIYSDSSFSVNRKKYAELE
jgi:hypothetical protein